MKNYTAKEIRVIVALFNQGVDLRPDDCMHECDWHPRDDYNKLSHGQRLLTVLEDLGLNADSILRINPLNPGDQGYEDIPVQVRDRGLTRCINGEQFVTLVAKLLPD